MYHILIAGAGSIGIAIGASLYSQGMTVTFLAREGTKQEIESGGVKRTGLFGDIDIPAGKVHTVSSLQELQEKSIDYVLVSTKTLVNDKISRTLNKNRHIMTSNAKIVLLQNGWSNDIPYLRYFSKNQIYQARIITGFMRTAPNISNITVHTAPILFGSLYGCPVSDIEPLAAAVNASGIPSETSQELSEALWAKMLYNTTLNPLGAILNVPYGKLADSVYARRIMDRLINETFSVMQASGYHTFWETPDAYREIFYGKLIPDTYAHRSSTLQDIEKKQKTEIHTLNGCIVRLAGEHGLKVPTHQMICELILSMEEQFS